LARRIAAGNGHEEFSVWAEKKRLRESARGRVGLIQQYFFEKSSKSIVYPDGIRVSRVCAEYAKLTTEVTIEDES
jgi:hypothetical protein